MAGHTVEAFREADTPRETYLVILLIGPAGSGKTTLGRLVAENERWIHLSEDDLWTEIGHPSHLPRDGAGQDRVHAQVHQRIEASERDRRNVLFEFLVYEDPPFRIEDYQRFLANRGIPFVTRVLRPTVETILERQRVRGRESDRDVEIRRLQAEQQLRCLRSEAVLPEWVIDSSGEAPEETYARHFRVLVEER